MGEIDLLSDQINELHPADLAEVLTHLPEKYKKGLLDLLSEEDRADVIAELDEDERELLLENFTPKEIAEQVMNSYSDPTEGCDHYNNPGKEGYPDWTNNCTRNKKIGGHQFYKAKF